MRFISTILLIFLAPLIFGQNVEYEKIKALYDSKKLKEAIELSDIEIRKVPVADRFYKKILTIRVTSYMELPDYKSAIKDWHLMIRIDSLEEDNYLNLSIACLMTGDTLNYLANMKKGLEINPLSPLALNNMSHYYGQVGKYKESIEYASLGLKQKVVENNLAGFLLNNRGYDYLKLIDLDYAAKYINLSIAYDSTNPYAYYNRALLNIERNLKAAVCKDLNKCKELGLSFPNELWETNCK